MAIGGCAVAIVAFADTSVLSRSYAARLGQKVDPNQEMVALGAVNLAAGLFQGFPISSSASRTPVAETAGAKTQLTGVVGAAVVALLLVRRRPCWQDLPNAALAAVVIAAVLGLFEFADLGRIYRIQRWEFWLSVACTVGVVVFGAIPGIMIALAIAVAEFLWDGWRPHAAVLGRVDGKHGFHDMRAIPRRGWCPGWCCSAGRRRCSSPTPSCSSGARGRGDPPAGQAGDRHRRAGHQHRRDRQRRARRAGQALREAGIELCFAELKDRVKDKLARFGLLARFGPESFQPTVGAAVDDYVAAHSIDWTP